MSETGPAPFLFFKESGCEIPAAIETWKSFEQLNVVQNC